MSNNLTLTLETVTPLFLGGAEARGTPELRPPAFRGALRYWLRAALGGVLGDDVEKVRKAEAAVFGSADEGGPGASAVTVRIAGQQRLSMESYSQIAGWDPERKSFSKPGTAYLFFAARRTQRESERNALLGTCSLNLSTRPGVAEPEDKFRKAYAAFWLLTHIGGIGARSRRGAGALQVTKIEGDASVIQGLPSPLVQAEPPEHLILELKQGLETIRHYIDPETSHR
ncbi:MAG: type III-B CRISPR module RAMP protein Cmr1, partial [Anaerolineae bacterium]|nr:type III-B CRISPR module RAMP protein Cmr1 [Anaerolineae bacterium]